MPSLQSEIPKILKYIDSKRGRLKDNTTIYNILEGDILSEIHKAIDSQLSGESRAVSKQRAVPINILRKVVDKLSSLYNSTPERVATGTSLDAALMDGYSRSLSIDDKFTSVNESFNAYKYGVNEIYLDDRLGEIRTRVLPADLFLPYAGDITDPARMTVMVKFMGSRLVKKGNSADLFALDADGGEGKNQVKTVNVMYLYSDTEFLSITGDGKILSSDMIGNEDHVNPYGVIPFGYVSRSKYELVPAADTDTIAMSVLIPLLMTEVNFGCTFLCNPIIYGINLDVSNLNISPLSFWNIKQDEDTDKEGKIDVLQPNMDISSQSTWIKEQLAMWLESKNIRATHLTNFEGDSVSSGIALIIREMDTTEDRNKQATYFTAFEREWWDILKRVHNTLAGAGRIKERKLFSNGFSVATTFAPVRSIEDKNQVYARATASYQAGGISHKRYLKMIFPEWSEAEIEAEVEEMANSAIDLKNPVVPLLEIE